MLRLYASVQAEHMLAHVLEGRRTLDPDTRTRGKILVLRAQ
jgi:hypothetical protein